MAYQNRITITIEAKDKASPALATAAARAKEEQTAVASAAEKSAAQQSAAADEVVAANTRSGASADGLRSKMGLVATAIAASVAVAAGVMLKNAADFQSSMTRLVTSAG